MLLQLNHVIRIARAITAIVLCELSLLTCAWSQEASNSRDPLVSLPLSAVLANLTRIEHQFEEAGDFFFQREAFAATVIDIRPRRSGDKIVGTEDGLQTDVAVLTIHRVGNHNSRRKLNPKMEIVVPVGHQAEAWQLLFKQKSPAVFEYGRISVRDTCAKSDAEGST